jgi:uncharacterized protein (DUF111 family)
VGWVCAILLNLLGDVMTPQYRTVLVALALVGSIWLVAEVLCGLARDLVMPSPVRTVFAILVSAGVTVTLLSKTLGNLEEQVTRLRVKVNELEKELASELRTEVRLTINNSLSHNELPDVLREALMSALTRVDFDRIVREAVKPVATAASDLRNANVVNNVHPFPLDRGANSIRE